MALPMALTRSNRAGQLYGGIPEIRKANMRSVMPKDAYGARAEWESKGHVGLRCFVHPPWRWDNF